MIGFHCFPSSLFLLFSLLLLLISIVFLPPPPPPHFYCFSLLLLISIVFPSSSASASSSSFLLFSLLLLLLLLPLILLFSILRPLVSFFFSTRFYKRLPTAIFSSFWSNVSCSEQQSWFSSAVSWLPCLSAPVSFKDSYSTTTTCTSPSLIQCTHKTHSYLRRK